jgi:hypothetical protein
MAGRATEQIPLNNFNGANQQAAVGAFFTVSGTGAVRLSIAKGTSQPGYADNYMTVRYTKLP